MPSPLGAVHVSAGDLHRLLDRLARRILDSARGGVVSYRLRGGAGGDVRNADQSPTYRKDELVEEGVRVALRITRAVQLLQLTEVSFCWSFGAGNLQSSVAKGQWGLEPRKQHVAVNSGSPNTHTCTARKALKVAYASSALFTPAPVLTYANSAERKRARPSFPSLCGSSGAIRSAEISLLGVCCQLKSSEW